MAQQKIDDKLKDELYFQKLSKEIRDLMNDQLERKFKRNQQKLRDILTLHPILVNYLFDEGEFKAPLLWWATLRGNTEIVENFISTWSK